MTWFTQRANVVVNENYDSKCDHLEIGDMAAMCKYENDGMGAPAQYFMCADCWKEHQEAELEETEFCHDCGSEHKISELTCWKPYDFYPPQGDEPLYICPVCVDRDEHKERVARDKASREAEYPEEADELDYYAEDCYDPMDDWEEEDDWENDPDYLAWVKEQKEGLKFPMANSKIGKVCLRLPDLFKGRVVYLSEPGHPVREGKIVRGPYWGTMVTQLVYDAADVHQSVLPVRGPNAEELEIAKSRLGYTDVMVKDFRSQVQYVDILIHGTVYKVQDIYFMPSESRLRVFAKRKQASNWFSGYSRNLKCGLVSLFDE